jgi:hypothetical protein
VNPLLRELVRARRLAETPVMAPILDKLGLTERPSYWGVDWVEVEGGLYRPADDGGRIALIIGVYQHGGLIDLLATSLETRAMRRRRGLGTLLGEDRLEHPLQQGKSLAVLADGLSWLAGGRKGVVILDWRDAALQLADMPALICESEALADRLRRAFVAEVFAAPPLFVPSGQPKERRHAA